MSEKIPNSRSPRRRGQDGPAPPAASCGLTVTDLGILAFLVAIGLVVAACRTYQTLGPAPQQIEFARRPQRPLEYRIDINRAEWPPLDLLPGVSANMARRIVEYRSLHGPFRRPSDLQKIQGIGPKLAGRLREHLTGWTDESEPPIRE